MCTFKQYIKLFVDYQNIKTTLKVKQVLKLDGEAGASYIISDIKFVIC